MLRKLPLVGTLVIAREELAQEKLMALQDAALKLSKHVMQEIEKRDAFIAKRQKQRDNLTETLQVIESATTIEQIQKLESYVNSVEVQGSDQAWRASHASVSGRTYNPKKW